jgi:hypothetical protein
MTPAQHAAWRKRIAASVSHAILTYGASANLIGYEDRRPTRTVITDWTAYPRRVSACLGASQAGLLLDWRSCDGDEGRRRLQEEYAEWRVFRAPDGRIARFELTTELPDYWVWLAGENPTRTLELVGQFAGDDEVDVREVYGKLDPFNDTASPAERAGAFAKEMLGQGGSAYNNGVRAICCMRQPSNTLGALMCLAVAAARPRLVRDPRTKELRPGNAAEIVPLLKGAAEIGRNSDPVIVEHLGRLASEARLIGFDGPPAVHVGGVQHDRLAGPDGAAIPEAWFSVERLTNAGAEPTLGQRLTFEVPVGEGFLVGDLTDIATGQPITVGAQLAELVQLVLYLRASDKGANGPQDGLVIPGLGGTETAAEDCDSVTTAWRESGLAPAADSLELR